MFCQEISNFYQHIETILYAVHEFHQSADDSLFARAESGWIAYIEDIDAWSSVECAPIENGGNEVSSARKLSLLPAACTQPPVDSIQCSIVTVDKSFWIGTDRGAAKWENGRWNYYAGKRWLPDDRVLSLFEDKQGRIWIGTHNGIARIDRIQISLNMKAAHYESITTVRHNREGYVTDCRLTRPGDLDSFLYEASDNDGLWTALYICAECFRYAVTGEQAAMSAAQKSMRAMLKLVEVTGISGFPARAIIRDGERVWQSDAGPNWFPSPIFPDIQYKNDTSSDEIVGHYLAWYVYSELVANDEEKKEIVEVCRAVTNHILDHDFTLVGPTGNRTSWGVWAPEYLNEDPVWRWERGLNSLEILSHLRVAMHLCGDTRYHNAYYELIEKQGYASNTIEQKVVPPYGENNHSDDELAAGAYYPLLMLEKDESLRAIYLESLERTHFFLRREGSPLYNTLYTACTGKSCDPERTISWLQDAPWDLRDWTVQNSHRRDISHDSKLGRFGERQTVEVLPRQEAPVGKWNRNPFAADGGKDGKHEEDGAFWLLPYWMAKYHDII